MAKKKQLIQRRAANTAGSTKAAAHTGYSVRMYASVERDLKKLDTTQIKEFFDWADNMEGDANPAITKGVKRLSYTPLFPLWRARLGHIRVMFALETAAKVLRVLQVLQRGEDTYDDLGHWQKVAKTEAGKSSD